MGKIIIGKVANFNNLVKAVDASGNEQILKTDSTVHNGDTIITEGKKSQVVIQFNDNYSTITIGGNEKVLLDNDVYDPNHNHLSENITSVAALKKVLFKELDQQYSN